jgi:TPP-dependent pyruvate/acetoin dehydrogenase alpha subunit
MKYVPRDVLAAWVPKDPILRYERYLVASGLAAQSDLDAVAAMIDRQLDLDLAFAESSPLPDPMGALDRVYADSAVRPPVPRLVAEWESRNRR